MLRVMSPSWQPWSPRSWWPHPLKNLNRGPVEPVAGTPCNSMALSGILYFSASDVAHASEVWWSDGKAAGAYRLTYVCPRG
jgi:ELWxxDGT repeat protein